ncbi:MAG: DUF924 domain-containing protein [Phormidesmis priestleyi]|uniref:DUF924 domain-containing protein n=1 Tax=Phormidesmis priestleyi TaxID=268141 RepID=A0A2W4X7D5_9CYAN|nr:MAG: DUF924 domain-containing protein [Phormidesmis priestleyi]
MDDRAEAVLRFWFGEPTGPDHGHYRKAWFIKNDDFDTQIRQHFLSDYAKAAAGEYADWIANPACAVALLLLLDQFPRNLFRGQPQSFASDPQALSVAQHLVTTGADKTLIPVHRFFVYLPFEHSENIEHQHQCVQLMQTFISECPNLDDGLKGGLDYAIRHRDVIQRFGRFPHRNEILKRQSTPAEIAFLQQPGSRF